MNTNQLQNLLNILKNTSDLGDYIDSNPMNAHREEFLKFRKDLLALVLKEENSFVLGMRFCWAQTYLADPSPDKFVRNRIVLRGLFMFAEMGIPTEETPALNQAILNVLQEYSKSETEDPEALSSYQRFSDVSDEVYKRFEYDPRFRSYFDGGKSGNYM